jgi:hypothetical protein
MSEVVANEQSKINNSIRSISGLPLSGNRVRAVVELAENHTKPNLLLTLTDADKNEVSRSLILGTILSHVEFTLHVRVPDPLKPLTLTCVTYLEDNQPFDTKSIEICDAS